MHEAALARAALPPTRICLGLLLRPFSLGHFVVLLRRGVLDDQFNIRIWDLPGAVLVCSQNWRENTQQDDRWLGLKLRLWSWRSRKADAKAELDIFGDYLKQGTLELPLSEVTMVNGENKVARPPGTPLVLILQQWLMTHFGLSEERAWDYPFGLAKMRWACHFEGEGTLHVYNAQDASFDQYAAAMDAKEAARAQEKEESKCRA